MLKYILSILLIFTCGAFAVAMTRRAEVIRHVAESTVVVEVDMGDRTAQGSGTVIASEHGFSFILTCHHVIEGAWEIEAYSSTDREHYKMLAFVEADRPDVDLAVLVVYAPLPPIPIAKNAPELYDTVYLFGAPQGEVGTASEGMITDLDRVMKGQHFYRTTNALLQPGISGGTAVNLEGEIIGVPARVMSSTSQQGLLVPLGPIQQITAGFVR